MTRAKPPAAFKKIGFCLCHSPYSRSAMTHPFRPVTCPKIFQFAIFPIHRSMRRRTINHWHSF